MGRLQSDGAISVLHVDDDPMFGELVGSYLEKLEDEVVVRSETDPEAAMEYVESAPVDCIVSDYEMPGLDGLQFLRVVRERYPNLPFILFTGRGSEEVATEAIDRGVSFYLQKSGSESYKLLANRVRHAVERARSEARARITRERLLELYEQTDGFFVLDESWTITYWSQQMVERTGKSPEEAVGAEFLSAFPEAEGTELYETYRSVMETGESTRVETYYEPHGYWVELRVYRVEEGLFVHSRDITRTKETELELEQRNQILKSFANTVSHDLQNPLSVAEGRLELAQETGDFEHLDAVAQAHNRMQNLIDELLRIAREDELTLSTVSLRTVAAEAWKTVTVEGTTLDVVADPAFEAHEQQLQRLFENLFWNAIEHGDAETIRVGRLDGVSASEASGGSEDEQSESSGGFFVEDDGSGIDPADRERVFEDGFSTAEDGTGYGLAIVESVIETTGWEITITEGELGGARFEVTGVEMVEE